MARKSPVCPTHAENLRRSEAKLKRGRGVLAVSKSGLSIIEWGQKHDPLFKIKGIKRHRMLHV
jgi:hypothetical protein